MTNDLAVPDMPLDGRGTKFDLPGGTLVKGVLRAARPIDTFQDACFQKNVSESIVQSW